MHWYHTLITLHRNFLQHKGVETILKVGGFVTIARRARGNFYFPIVDYLNYAVFDL